MKGLNVHRLQIRACAILWDRGEFLLQAPRDNPTRWALPGGRLEKGETLQDCLRREFAEEMDLNVRPGRLVAVHENFYDDEGTPTQEYGFYFLCEAEHASSELRARTADPVERHLLFRWAGPAALKELAIYPHFLRHMLLAIPEEVQFLSTRDATR